MQMVSTNIYMVKNIANVAETWSRELRQALCAHGIRSRACDGICGGYIGMDPELRMVHDDLWGPIMGGSAATGVACVLDTPVVEQSATVL